MTVQFTVTHASSPYYLVHIFPHLPPPFVRLVDLYARHQIGSIIRPTRTLALSKYTGEIHNAYAAFPRQLIVETWDRVVSGYIDIATLHFIKVSGFTLNGPIAVDNGTFFQLRGVPDPAWPPRERLIIARFFNWRECLLPSLTDYFLLDVPRQELIIGYRNKKVGIYSLRFQQRYQYLLKTGSNHFLLAQSINDLFFLTITGKNGGMCFKLWNLGTRELVKKVHVNQSSRCTLSPQRDRLVCSDISEEGENLVRTFSLPELHLIMSSIYVDALYPISVENGFFSFAVPSGVCVAYTDTHEECLGFPIKAKQPLFSMDGTF